MIPAFAAPPEDEEGGLFDLFGRRVDPTSSNVEGLMPEGELKVVVDPVAPRLFSKSKRKRSYKRKVVASPSQPRIPSNAKRIFWGRKDQLVVNVTSNQATHVVQSGGRVLLRNFE